MADPLAVAGYRTLAARIRGSTLTAIAGTWASLQPTDIAIEQWVSTMAPFLDAAQHRVGAATSSYLAAVAPEGQRTPIGVPADAMTSEALRGVPSDELLHRAPEQFWTALSEGQAPPEAQHRGAMRAAALVLTGLQLAHTHAARRVLQVQRAPRYRRATRAGACNLCQAAASHIYRSADLMPIHDHCACVVVPVWGGDGLPGEDLEADERFEDEVTVRTHGELGPVLVDPTHHFRGPAAIP